MSKFMRSMIATAVVAVATVLLAPSAVEAGVGASAVPSFPSTITLGDSGVTASIVLRNQNTIDADGDEARPNTVCNEGDAFPCPAGGQGITLVPSCGVIAAPTACDPTGADPGVFVLGPTATGSGAGSSECGGMTFTVALLDPVFGTYQFTPTSGNVTLSGRDAFCQIDFTYDVVQLPTIDQDPGTAGVQTAQVVANTQIVEVGSPNRSVPGSGSGTSVRTIDRAQPSITTEASPNLNLGTGVLTDTAVLTGTIDPQPGATITFDLYPPSDPSCAGPEIFTSTVPYPVAGGPVTSAAYTPTTVGRFRWVASYSGDVNNAPTGGSCGDADESTVVRQARPTISTTASSSIALGGGTLTDAAVVSGRVNPQPGATIDFLLYGPDDPTCSRAPVFTSLGVAVPISDGPVTSAAYTPIATGTYRWVATYSGDLNNRTVAGTCNDAGESASVDRAMTTILTAASSNVAIGGGPLTDTATVSGRVNPQPGATIEFRLYGPDDADCSGTPVFESLGIAYPVAGGAVTSEAYTPEVVGVYRWVASYSGDANNEPSSGLCGDASEMTTVTPGTPTIVTAASADVVLGQGTLTDSATISGRSNPVAGGTVDFRLYGPDDSDCSGTPVFESLGIAYPVAGGAVSSLPFTPTSPGTYRWVAGFNGDSNNVDAQGVCNDVNETTEVFKATPTIVTTASGDIDLGAGTLSDQATVSSRFDPQIDATVTFRLYGPNDALCAGTPVFESLPVAYPVAGGPVTSPSFTPNSAGVYRWRAFYSGDDNNEAVAGACNDADETVEVRSPLATQLPATGSQTGGLVGTGLALTALGLALLGSSRRRPSRDLAPN